MTIIINQLNVIKKKDYIISYLLLLITIIQLSSNIANACYRFVSAT